MKPKYNDNGVLISEFKDSDMSKDARASRYKEYCGLDNLPFFTKEQSKRLTKLYKLRIRDNRFAFDAEKENELAEFMRRPADYIYGEEK